MKYFSSQNGIAVSLTNLERFFDENISLPLQREVEEFETRDSGWNMRRILNLTININKHEPLRGSSFIKLPAQIYAKRACINVQNRKDNECFKWAVLAAYYPRKSHASEFGYYYKRKEQLGEINFQGLSFPMPPEQVEVFEKNNSDISIHLYILKKKHGNFGVYPYYLSPEKKKNHFHLLIIKPEEYYVDEMDEEYVEQSIDKLETYPNFHYVWIKDFPKLVGRQYSTNEHRIHVCDRCLHFFYEQKKLDAHENDCKLINKCKVTLPSEKEKNLTFKNVNHQERVPFIIYADIECILKPIHETPDGPNTKTEMFQKHIPHSIGFYFKNSYSKENSGYRSYRQQHEDQETPAHWFVRQLQELCPEIQRIISKNELMNFTAADAKAFNKATNCSICKKPFTPDSIKVRDHCHFTGR